MVVNPKTSAAALGGSAGILVAGVLHSISGLHLTPEVYAAIPTFLSTLLAYLAPNQTEAPVATPEPVAPEPATPAPVEPAV